jgi:type II secretory pathway pseudopilin PulG
MDDNVTLPNENGFVLVASLLILLLLVVIGTNAVTNSTIEIQIAGNERAREQAFYAAEAARGYVEATPHLYDSSNLDTVNGINFPHTDAAVVQTLGALQSFSGNVVYVKEGGYGYLRGDKGYSVGEGTSVMTAHVYKMSVVGNGPTNALSKIEAGFFRIGLK